MINIERVLNSNPLKELGLKKVRDEGRARDVSEDTINKLLSVMDLTTYAGLRDYGIMLLTLDTGIRPSEAFGLKEEDIDINAQTIIIRSEIAKTRRSRTLPICAQTVHVIRSIIDIKPTDWDRYILNTVEGNQMIIYRWEKRLSAYSKTIGEKISPYDLRHTFAIMFLRNNGNVFALQQELGHTDLTMTRRYNNLAQNDLREQHNIASSVHKFVKRTTRLQKLFK